MAKDREKKIAYDMYVYMGKTAKEISERTGVSEKTLSGWINANEGLWKKERESRNMSPAKRVANIEQIISGLADKRLKLDRELDEAENGNDPEKAEEIRKSIAKTDDAVSKWNKTLRDINKENRIPLAVYLEVMQSIFDALKIADQKLYMKTIDFQEKHIHDISIKLSI
jgi:sugar-specific transcriptional regulator TrmB